jgi:hypothetical protein
MFVALPILLTFLARKEAAMHEIASFGRWLKLRRIALELTQAELARHVSAPLRRQRPTNTATRGCGCADAA